MIRLHADDYGITPKQSSAMLELCATDGQRSLESMSIFANSPCFDEAAQMLETRLSNGSLDLSLHLNLVEGPSCADPSKIEELVDDRGMFKNDFVKLLLKGARPRNQRLYDALVAECTAQIDRFTSTFPQFKDSMRIDSHQHTHMIPIVFEAMMTSIAECKCTLRQLRVPTEDITPYEMAGKVGDITFANRVKNVLLTSLARRCADKIPEGCATLGFCGVLLSGNMDKTDANLTKELDAFHARNGRDVEVLFHPISVPMQDCLDPNNVAFASACASPARDREALTIQALAV